MTTRVKICGINSLNDAMLCVDAGVDAVGFVTEYPVPVPWNVGRERTRELISKLPPFVSSTVVTSGNIGKILEIAKDTNPDVIQLHGEEPLTDIEKAVEKLTDDGIRVIKALSIDVDTQRAHFEIPDPIEAAHSLQDLGIQALVLDSRTKSMPAGTGTTLNWGIAREIREATSIPIILAGGLNQWNVRDAIRAVRPYAVDVITGVEAYPGKKDPDKVKAFVKSAKNSAEESVLNHEQGCSIHFDGLHIKRDLRRLKF
jgi:phosphoribosylanthranilate isomerase